MGSIFLDLKGDHTNTTCSDNFILYRKSDKHILISSTTPACTLHCHALYSTKYLL